MMPAAFTYRGLQKGEKGGHIGEEASCEGGGEESQVIRG